MRSSTVSGAGQSRSRCSFNSCDGAVGIEDASDLAPHWAARSATCSRITALSLASCSALSERADAARRRATLRWLQYPEVSLAEVAYLVGFMEQALLTRAVRRRTGQTRGQLRRAGRH